MSEYFNVMITIRMHTDLNNILSADAALFKNKSTNAYLCSVNNFENGDIIVHTYWIVPW